MRSPLPVTLALTLCAAVPALWACVTDYEEGQTALAPQPAEIPTPPSSLVVNRVAFHPTLYARDMNGNGIGDRLDATIYLWSEPYPFPFHADGTLSVYLYRVGEYSNADAQPLREWNFTPEQLTAARAKALPGPCYYIELSLLDDQHRAGDNLNLDAADLVARFTQTGKRTITSGLSTVHLDHPAR